MLYGADVHRRAFAEGPPHGVPHDRRDPPIAAAPQRQPDRECLVASASLDGWRCS